MNVPRKPMRIHHIYRENRLAGQPENDRAILDAVADALRSRGHTTASAPNAHSRISADVILHMARGKKNLETLKKLAGKTRVLNAPRAVDDSYNGKWNVYQRLKKAGLAIPSSYKTTKNKIKITSWDKKIALKCAGIHGIPNTSFIVSNADELKHALKLLPDNEIVVQEFVEGTHVKFYGVKDKIFPEGLSASLKQKIRKAGRIVGLVVYGGDLIMDGTKPVFVDINDWPSFSSIRQEAAAEIAKLVERRKW